MSRTVHSTIRSELTLVSPMRKSQIAMDAMLCRSVSRSLVERWAEVRTPIDSSRSRRRSTRETEASSSVWLTISAATRGAISSSDDTPQRRHARSVISSATCGLHRQPGSGAVTWSPCRSAATAASASSVVRNLGMCRGRPLASSRPVTSGWSTTIISGVPGHRAAEVQTMSNATSSTGQRTTRSSISTTTASGSWPAWSSSWSWTRR
jgi:hypothetical protein